MLPLYRIFAVTGNFRSTLGIEIHDPRALAGIYPFGSERGPSGKRLMLIISISLKCVLCEFL